MKSIQFSKLLACILVITNVSVHAQNNSTAVEKQDLKNEGGSEKYGALAIDRGNGVYYGWASDCVSLAEAEKKAIDECSKMGGECTIVLSYSGTGCAAYRFISGNVGMGYGWGLAKTKEEADVKAKKECAERSFGLPAPNMVWKCNSPNSGVLRALYDAHDEINRSLPKGVELDY